MEGTQKVASEVQERGPAVEGGDPLLGPIDGATGGKDAHLPTEGGGPVSNSQNALQQAEKFYTDSLAAMKGAREILELAYVPGRLAAKVGPGIRILDFFLASTKAELKKIEAEITATRTIQAPVKKGPRKLAGA